MWWQVHGSETACLCFLTHGCLPIPVAGFFILVRKEALVRGGKITAGRKKNEEQLLKDLGMGEGGIVVWFHLQMIQTGVEKRISAFQGCSTVPVSMTCKCTQVNASWCFCSHSPGLQQLSLSLVLGFTLSQGHTMFIQLGEFLWTPGTSLALLLCLYFSTPCLQVSKSLAVRPQHTICASHTNTGHGGGKEETQTLTSS